MCKVMILLTFVLSAMILLSDASDPLQCQQPNEIMGCAGTCPPERTCQNKDIQFNCLKTKPHCPCKPTCVCKEGYYRNSGGYCVTEAQCDKCSGPHEYHSCGGACDNDCATLHTQNQTVCPYVNIKCNEMCYCEEGYARDQNKQCVPIEKCQKPPRCGLHEVFNHCTWNCPPDTCLSLVAKFRCDYETTPCKPMCVCESGFKRLDSNSPCMPIKQCPQLASSPDFN